MSPAVLEGRLLEDCRQAIDLLDASKTAPVEQMIELVDAAERKVVEVRDEIILRLRASEGSGDHGSWRAALDRVNATLSGLASVEYPGELERANVDMVRRSLQQVVR